MLTFVLHAFDTTALTFLVASLDPFAPLSKVLPEAVLHCADPAEGGAWPIPCCGSWHTPSRRTLVLRLVWGIGCDIISATGPRVPRQIVGILKLFLFSSVLHFLYWMASY